MRVKVTMAEDMTNRLPIPVKAPLRNKSNQALAIRQSKALCGDYVAHLDISQVKRLADLAGPPDNDELGIEELAELDG